MIKGIGYFDDRRRWNMEGLMGGGCLSGSGSGSGSEYVCFRVGRMIRMGDEYTDLVTIRALTPRVAGNF